MPGSLPVWMPPQWLRAQLLFVALVVVESVAAQGRVLAVRRLDREKLQLEH